MTITYLTGVSSAGTRASERADLGVLATPASGVYGQRDDYPAWAADNAMFAAPPVTGADWTDALLGEPDHLTATAREVRHTTPSKEEARWLTWIESIDPAGALWATLPDVVGDAVATWERSARYISRVRALGFPVAIVLQNGVENEPFIWQSILNGADAVFLGGSPECVPCGYVRPIAERGKTCPLCDAKLVEWKLGAAAEALTAEALARGLQVHMGRVNSRTRLAYAKKIGCHTADGTYIGYAPTVNAPKVEGWLEAVNAPPPVEQLELAA
jgi:hypothetical protein